MEWIIGAREEPWKGAGVVWCIATGRTDVWMNGFGVNTILFGWYSRGTGDGLG